MAPNRWGGFSAGVFFVDGCGRRVSAMTAQGQIPGTAPKRPSNVRTVVVSTLADLIRRTALGDIGPAALAAALRELASVVDGKGATSAPGGVQKGAGAEGASPKTQEMLEAWKRIFAYWQKATGKSRARPSSDKRDKVYARIREGFSEADICRAIDGCVGDEWHAERSKFDLPYICQNATTLEGFIERAGGSVASTERVVPEPREAELEALQERQMAALEAGDGETYEKLQEQIERIQRAG